MEFPLLFHKGKKNVLYSWKTWTDGADVVTEYGQVDGEKMQARKRCVGKNLGKKNETTPDKQADSEAAAMHTFKLERKYSLTTDDAALPLKLPMLAYDIEKVKDVIFPLDVQPKLDGVRCLAFWEDGEVVLLSRGGKPYNIPHITKALEAFLPENITLDGEIYIHGSTFQEIVTLVKKNREGSERLQYHCYDAIEDGADDSPWSSRKVLLENVLDPYDGDLICLVPSYPAAEMKHLEDLTAHCLVGLYEGSIVRHLHGPYLFGYRSRDLLKVKTFDDAEFRIVGYSEGIGKFVACPIWLCETSQGKTFSVVQRGSLEDKRLLWADRDACLKKLLKVKYFGLTDDGLPRFPVGLGFRLEEDL